MNGGPGCALLEWDTQFFGCRIARLAPAAGTAPDWPAIAGWCRDQAVACLYYQCPAEDGRLVRGAEQAGFQLVDIRMELEHPLAGPVPVPAPPAGVVLRTARAGDLPALQELARAGHRNTRFFRDGHFPAARCAELYATWLANSCRDERGAVWVAEVAARPVAYCTAGQPAERRGNIGLLAVAATHRRLGLGRLLVGQALAWFRAQGLAAATVVTQGGCVPAQRLYQQAGFVTTRVALTYHKWFPPERGPA